jgi:hypothetical protein
VKALVDNDVLFKGTCYRLLDEFLGTIYKPSEAVGVLGAARYVVKKRIERHVVRSKYLEVLEGFFAFLERNIVLEPTSEEQVLAADFELSAQRLGVSLDAGESQLCSIFLHRAAPLLVTGDKRAIISIDRLIDVDPRLEHLMGKVKCLEQLVQDALSAGHTERVRGAICSEPEVDLTLSICFGCSSPDTPEAHLHEGLTSYIHDLRSRAERVLYP